MGKGFWPVGGVPWCAEVSWESVRGGGGGVLWECSGPGPRFSKSPETFRAEDNFLKSKLVE